MLARDKGNFHAPGKNRTRDAPVQCREFNSHLGTKIFVVPGEHDFFPFQVENVHWKCMCAVQ